MQCWRGMLQSRTRCGRRACLPPPPHAVCTMRPRHLQSRAPATCRWQLLLLLLPPAVTRRDSATHPTAPAAEGADAAGFARRWPQARTATAGHSERLVSVPRHRVRPAASSACASCRHCHTGCLPLPVLAARTAGGGLAAAIACAPCPPAIPTAAGQRWLQYRTGRDGST